MNGSHGLGRPRDAGNIDGLFEEVFVYIIMCRTWGFLKCQISRQTIFSSPAAR